jgi:hypothetical protein
MTHQDLTPQFIQNAIKMRLKAEADRLMEEAKKELELRTPEIITSVVLDVMSMVSFEDHKDRVVFTIKKEG